MSIKQSKSWATEVINRIQASPFRTPTKKDYGPRGPKQYTPKKRRTLSA